MAINLFGNLDSWNTADSDLTFLKKTEAKSLFKGLKILAFKEWKNEGRTALGELKVCHIYGIVAKKPKAKSVKKSRV